MSARVPPRRSPSCSPLGPRAVALACALGVASVAGASRAEDAQTDAWDGDYGKRAKVRSDFFLGGGLGVLAGQASGYPNEIGKIDVPEFEASTGAGFGSSMSLWLGGALTDWFVFAFGATTGGISGGGYAAGGAAFVLRVEAFPFIARSGALRELGFQSSFGIGTLTIEKGGDTAAEGGGMSYVSAGAFHESWRPGTFALGPSVDWVHLWSLTATEHVAQVGLRVAYTTGP
ncbi:MAG: hypothetical protein IT376_07640 [Polyangiaceae bacterium]|nr:hypothetical protein [Polyangiaceae bacterium]